MSTYSSKTTRVEQNSQYIADKFADLTVLEALRGQLPPDQLDQLGALSFEPDAIVIDTPQLGQIRFAVTRRDDHGVLFQAVGTPLPLEVKVDLDPVSEQATDVTTSIDVDIPVMLRPFIGSKLNQVVDALGQIMVKIAER